MDTLKEKRIEIRSSEDEKQEFEEAAAIVHMGLSEFIRFATHLYVKKVHEEHQNMLLSKEAGMTFLNALENPPEPSEKLKEAMRKHSKNVKK